MTGWQSASSFPAIRTRIVVAGVYDDLLFAGLFRCVGDIRSPIVDGGTAWIPWSQVTWWMELPPVPEVPR